MTYVIAFGDSLSSQDTLVPHGQANWYTQLPTGPFPHTPLHNRAEGGAVTGPDNVYTWNGVEKHAPGIVQQVDAYIGSSYYMGAATHVIWPGTNDLVIACMLDPFQIIDPANPWAPINISVTPVVSDYRHVHFSVRGESVEDYVAAVVRDYTTVHLESAITALKAAGVPGRNIVVVGPWQLQKAPLVVQHTLAPAKIALAALGTELLRSAVKDVARNHGVNLAHVDGITPTFVDPIHLDEGTHLHVRNAIVAAGKP